MINIKRGLFALAAAGLAPPILAQSFAFERIVQIENQPITDVRVELTKKERFKEDNTDESAYQAAISKAAESKSGNRPSSGVLEEVIVTAQKRAERLIDVPQSLTVLSADDLTKLGALQFTDFANTVPGLTFQTATPGWTQVTLRGVTAGFDVSPTVASYVDDVPYGSTTSFARAGQLALDMSLSDLDQIEVLRGPQGTLYGASTMGGLLKYVTRLPDMNRMGGSAKVSISGTQNGGTGYNVATSINVPLSNKVALRASGFMNHGDGYIDNIGLGQKDVNSSDRYGGRLDLLLTPTDRFSVRINGFVQNISSDGLGIADFNLNGTPVYGSLIQRRFVTSSFDTRFRLVSGTANYDFGPAMLTSVSSYQSAQGQFFIDFGPTIAPAHAAALQRSVGGVGVTVDSDTDKFTQEVRLASESGGVFEWLIGGFYTRESSEDISGTSLMVDSVGIPFTPPFSFLNVTSIPSTYEEYAVFGDLTWRLTKKFDVTGGVRYARNSTTFAQDVISAETSAVTSLIPETRSVDHPITYLASARYYFNNQATGYLRYATGYRPGGPNFLAVDPVTGDRIGLPEFEADELKSYEAGFKAETTDHRFGLDLAAYYIDWSDIQITIVQGGIVGRGNAPGATVRGAELTLTARPTNGVSLTGAFGFTNARMSEDAPTLRARANERLPSVPRFTGALNADYEIPRGNLQPTIGATLRYVGERPASYDAATSPPQYWLPAYEAVDLRAGLVFGAFSTQLYVHNLLDERGQVAPRMSGITAATGPYAVAILQPRTFGVRVSTSF